MQVNNAWISLCFSCQKLAVWVHDRMLFPRHDHHIAPNADLPDEIKKDFLEAAEILDASPRGSAALLRLCIQKLCKHLGKSGDNINKDIADLVQDGLDKRIKNSLDIVRVIGNNAVHPGQINLTDDKDTASSLFKIVNIICETMISQPKHIDELYELIPPSTKKQIEKRDEAAELKKREKETS